MPPGERGTTPFLGGQCADIPYTITIGCRLILFPKSANVDVGQIAGNIAAIGAVTSARFYYTGDTDNDLRIAATWKGGSYDESLVKGTSNNSQAPQWGFTNPTVSIVRTDGLPDVCGNPPRLPPVFPPGGNVINNNVIYIDAGGNTINAPVTLRFGIPRIDVRGEFNIPVTINFNNDPTLNIGGDVNFNTGNFTINVGGGSPPPGVGVGDPDNIVKPPTTPPMLPPGVPLDPPGTVPGEPGAPPATPPTIPTQPPTRPPNKKTYRVIRGVIVTVTQAETDATIIFQGDTPDIYAPSLGHVSFLCKVGGAFGWTVDIPVKNRRQLIPCPWQFGAIEVKGTAKGGAVFFLDPIYDDVPVANFPT